MRTRLVYPPSVLNVNPVDSQYPSDHGTADIYRFRGQPVRPVWPTRDLSAMTTDYTAEDGDVLTGTTTHSVSIPAGATVTINGVSVTGLGGGTVNPAQFFRVGFGD